MDCNKGSALSPIIFNIMMHDIPLEKEVNISLIADDCAIWKSGKNDKFVQNKVQTYLH